MNDDFYDGGVSLDVREVSSQGEEIGKDAEENGLGNEESFVDSEESLTGSEEEETAGLSGFGVSSPPPLLGDPAISGSGVKRAVSEPSGSSAWEDEGMGLDTVSDVFDMDDRELLAQEAQADAYGDSGGPLSTTDSLLFAGDMFLALILGAVGASIFGRFWRVYV